MSWNYRVFKHDSKPIERNGVTEKLPPFYFVGECYYDEDGKPEMHSTMEHNHVNGDSFRETQEAYKMIGEAFNAPMIELDEDGNFK